MIQSDLCNGLRLARPEVGALQHRLHGQHDHFHLNYFQLEPASALDAPFGVPFWVLLSPFWVLDTLRHQLGSSFATSTSLPFVGFPPCSFALKSFFLLYAAWVRSRAERPSVSYTKVVSNVAWTGHNLQFIKQLCSQFCPSTGIFTLLQPFSCQTFVFLYYNPDANSGLH